MEKAIRNIVNILTVLVLLAGTMLVIQNCCKIFSTAANLIVLNDNIQFYNEQPRKTDAMTERARYYYSERQKFYNSEDVVVRTFSNLPSIVKILVLILVILMFPMIFFMWFYHIVRKIFMYRRRRARQRAKHAKRCY